MADPMRIRAVARDGAVNVKILVAHEMETGQRKDASGKLVPPHFIQNVRATYQGKVVLSAQWGPAISKNPFLEFNFKGGRKGDKIVVTWDDNKGESRTDESTIN
jgi:sulfur-oxidizing protein SoxZ